LPDDSVSDDGANDFADPTTATDAARNLCATAQPEERPAMTVFVYVNTSKQVSEEHLKIFATSDAAENWFEENDPEGVASMRSRSGSYDLSPVGRLNSEIVDPLARLQLLEQPARPLATTGPSL
jgi:hypothetical protein